VGHVEDANTFERVHVLSLSLRQTPKAAHLYMV
jgi:hypothetical protein